MEAAPAPAKSGADVYMDIDKRIKGFSLDLACAIAESIREF